MDLTRGPQYDYIERGEYMRLLKIEEKAKALVVFIRDEGPPAKEWQAISAVTGELGNLLNIPTE